MNNHKSPLSPLVAEIIAAYVTNNKVTSDDLPDLIDRIHQSFINLDSAATPQKKMGAPQPAVPVLESICDDALICLEDGRKMKMLKRYLKTHYNLTPEQYRARWGLPKNYPMVAPNYAKKRSKLAQQSGLGKKAKSSNN